ncbi:MAG: hypothetical protein Q9P90_07675 [candidate division KSB1 bacterium]|nr:hypothetical protein [candidate division KSB1 bacterium]
MRRLRAALLLILLWPRALMPQSYEDIMDRLAGAEIGDLADVLQQMIVEPVEINQLSPDSVAGIWFLTAAQKERLAELLRRKAPRITYHDLMDILALPPEAIRVMFHAEPDRRPQRHFWSRLQWRRQAAGAQHSTRVRFQLGAYTMGSVTEKDAGEPRWLDFISGFVQWQSPEPRVQLLFGDFTLQCATGLAFSGAYGNPALSLPEHALRFAEPKIAPYASVLENTAFRGAAFRWQRGAFLLIGFYSAALRDASLDSTGRVISRPPHGYHRTSREQAAARTLRETTAGWIVRLSPAPTFQLGIAGYDQHFDRYIVNPDRIRRQFAFAGQHKRLFDAFFRWQSRSGALTLFGEMATMADDRAAIAGLQYGGPRHRFVVAAWQAQPAFQNDHGALPGERTGDTSNQTGAYLGLTLRSRSGRWSSYVHRVRTLWRTFFLPMPVQHGDLALLWERRVARGFWLQWRLRFRTQQVMSPRVRLPQQARGEVLIESRQASLRMRLRIKLARRLLYRFGVDALNQKRPAEPNRIGYAQYHALHASFGRWLDLRLKWTDFLADDYDSRVYQFDAFFPNWVQPVALYSEGQRWLVTFRIRAGRRAHIAGYWLHEKRDASGRKREFGFQLQWQQ